MDPNSLSVLNPFIEVLVGVKLGKYGRREKGELSIPIDKLILFQLCP